jgi:hypothetical protein
MVAPRFEIPARVQSRSRSIIPRRGSHRSESWDPVLRELAWEGIDADVYMAFIGSGRLQLSGFLVTAKSDINRVIAHCPVTLERNSTRSSSRHIHGQLQLAQKIAENPRLADETDDVVSFSRLARAGRPIPRWVYALACIPLTYATDGQFLYPTPFCPQLDAELTSHR